MDRKKGRPEKYGFSEIEEGGERVFFSIVQADLKRIRSAATTYSINHGISFSTCFDPPKLTVKRNKRAENNGDRSGDL